MKQLRLIHLYLGCAFAPALIFFSITGIWQMFDYHKTLKDGSYTAPPILKVLSEAHKHQRLNSEKGGELPLRIFFLAASVGLVVTTVLGIVMAFKLANKPWTVVTCLVLGVVLPVGMILLR